MTSANETSSAFRDDGQFLRVLPFFIQPIVGDRDLETPMPVALWRQSAHCCEGGDDTRCDDSEELYYTIAGDEVTWWCPRHWYESSCGPDAPYRLLDMTDEQFQKECHAQQQRFLKDWKTVSDRIETAAAILSRVGLQEEAGKLWEAHGYIRSSIHGRSFISRSQRTP